MTEIEAYELALKIWTWLSKNPGKYKSEYPEYIEKGIDKMTGACPLCDFFPGLCRECVGYKDEACFNGAFSTWVYGKEDAKLAAEHIRSEIENRLKELKK